jgi:magnesium chelatase family protein
MAVCRVRSLSLFSIDALPVEVEVDVSAGLPGFSIVGLSDAAVQEARERVRVAISNPGYKFPTKKVIVNLAPAGLRKEGGAFDLPMALGILASSGLLPPAGLEGTGVVGEVSLDGECGARGALHGRGRADRWVGPPRRAGGQRPRGGVRGGVEVYGVRSLREAAEFLRTGRGVEPAEPWREEEAGPEEAGQDFADVVGQAYAKRALEVAAAVGTTC